MKANQLRRIISEASNPDPYEMEMFLTALEEFIDTITDNDIKTAKLPNEWRTYYREAKKSFTKFCKEYNKYTGD